MDSAAHNFLRRACGAIQQYDRNGQALVPLGAWPLILEDLQLDGDGEQAEFLKGHLDVADEGFFSYTPLLEALGVKMQRSDAEAQRPSPPSSPSRADDDSLQRQQMPSSPRGNRMAPSGPEFASDSYGEPPRPPAAAQRREGGAGPSSGMSEVLGSRRPAPLEDIRGDAFEDEGEDLETFWSRRASTIQHFFNLWDCNQLTNEAFTVQLQHILGPRVDLMAPDSEVMRLTNQNRYARNLKFAQLMSALRKDARYYSLSARPSDAGSPAGGAPSISGSVACSETPSCAAGRPSKKFDIQASGVRGRKHYTPSESGFGDDGNASIASGIRREPKPRTPAPYADMSDIPSKPDSRGRLTSANLREHVSGGYSGGMAPVPEGQPCTSAASVRSPAPYAFGGNFEEGYRRPPSQQSATRDLPDAGPSNFWDSRGGPPGRSDVQSQCGQSDIQSVADSQCEIFTARDRGGHGNILTWGSNSRNITPTRKRQGRQIAVESDGVPKAYAASRVFPQSADAAEPFPRGEAGPYNPVLSPSNMR